jgi:hypothetical protein
MRNITSFLDLESDGDSQTPGPSFVPAPQEVATKQVQEEPLVCEDPYRIDAGPVHVGDIDALEDRTQEYKRLQRDSIALRDLQLQLAEQIESQDESLLLLDEQMVETKNDQQHATFELIATMRNRVRHLRRKCTGAGAGVGLVGGLGVGGVVFSAPVVGLAVGLVGGSGVGLGVGQKLRRRWRRREETLTASIPPEQMASFNESMLDKATKAGRSATDSFMSGAEAVKNGAESFVTGRKFQPELATPREEPEAAEPHSPPSVLKRCMRP